MKIPSEFDSIRPYEPEELAAVYDKLLADKQFQQVVAYVYPNVPMEAVAKKMHACKTNLDFQRSFCYIILQKLIAEQSNGIDMDFHNLDIHKRYTFVSNHRDIVLDSAFLDKCLIDTGFGTTSEIAIGDNLLQLDWVRALARINIWIAQREGRAKNSNDLTQPAILKMMAMGGEGSIIDRLTQLHIVPLAISYQYDPCDYLKAREYQLRRDLPYWKKAPGDDMESMSVGIKGFKGHIHYCCAPCIDEWLQTVSQEQPRNKMFEQIAEHIDHEIHRNYLLYPQNYIALDIIQNTKMYADHYTQDDFDNFEEYIASRLALIDIDNKDEAYLRRCLLTQYAYPTRNYLTATETTGRLKQFFSKFNFTK